MANLTRYVGGAQMLVKRDDCTGLAMGGNKIRQLEFYLGDALSQEADALLITGAVQSNFVRSAIAGGNRFGMQSHVQLERRVQRDDHLYASSGNVLLDQLLGATIHRYPDGEDEAGADRGLEAIAAK
ncbi:MAG: pyridoxal-phosphate dependent enzyme, partial [Acidimicrobiales bacterium]